MSYTPVSFTCLAIKKEKNNANHVTTVNLLSVAYIWKNKGGRIYDFYFHHQGGDDTVLAFVLGERLYRLYLHVKGSDSRYVWEFVILNLDVPSGFNSTECFFFNPPVVISGIAGRQILNSVDSPTFLS